MEPIVYSWILCLSLAGFWLMGWDKARARERGGRRIPERLFIALALFGGAAGIWLGMFVFRHKTRKLVFLSLGFLLLLQLSLLYWLGLKVSGNAW